MLSVQFTADMGTTMRPIGVSVSVTVLWCFVVFVVISNQFYFLGGFSTEQKGTQKSWLLC